MEDLIETIKIVYDKRQKGIPVTGAKEEIAEDFINDWNELFSDALTSYCMLEFPLD